MEYFNGQRGIDWGIAFGFLMCLLLFLNISIHSSIAFTIYRYGMQLRLGICGLIYKKVGNHCETKFSDKNTRAALMITFLFESIDLKI
jgi:hypothetical protein